METILKLQVGTIFLTSVVLGSMDYQMDSKVNTSLRATVSALFDKEAGNKIGLHLELL